MAMVIKKTKANGSISATWHEMGISIGKYADKSVASLDEMESGNGKELVLLIHKGNCEELGVRVEFIDKWPEEQEQEEKK